MTALFRPVYALAKTKRRRFLWCVWSTCEPTEAPFRAPDAWGGGARTEDEAKARAEAAAGMPLDRIDGRWAGAWKRSLAGLPPFPKVSSSSSSSPDTRQPAPNDPYAILGINPSVSLNAVKVAFRQKALEHHPDHGGETNRFIAVKHAFDTITKRRARRGER